VGEQAFGGWANVNVEEVIALQRVVDSHLHIPLMARPNLFRSHGERTKRFVEIVARLYRAIAAVSGAEVVVDSTKRPSSAFLLATVPFVDLRFVQLVRDSRGVAFSWSKRVERPEVVGRVDFMPRYSTVEAGLRWVGNNSLFHLLAKRGVPGVRVRYESLVENPSVELERLVCHAGLPVGQDTLAFLDGSRVRFTTNHVVAGNPLRLRKDVELRRDDVWRTRMGRPQRSLVFLLTWPLLLRYGYLGGADAVSGVRTRP
jgi:hypothetical protein